LQVAQNGYIAYKLGARSKQGMNKQPALRIHFSQLAIVISSVQKFSHSRVACALRLKLLFNRHPLGHGIQPCAFAGDARDVKLRAVVLIDIAAVSSRHLDPPLLVHPDSVVTSQHPVSSGLHFVPLHSTTPSYGTSDG